ncbi:MAG: DUF5107 domain-containing protein [Bacteroidota bacterium]
MVKSQSTRIALPTSKLGAPEKNPVFFEKRVYQGSSGKVYPVPFIDKVYDEMMEKLYHAEILENDYVRLVMLPEIGGRIFEAQDKANKNYNIFYQQEIIKPALVGLAGPWISGGVEFNWPQHHRPGTFLPTDVFLEKDTDGSKTLWMSELDPMNRMKGMHGIKISPNSALIELKGRLYNRTSFLQTFLWWANVAVRVHEDYESFFPRDVHYVADHAVRAMSSFPIAQNYYYGIPYHDRPGKNDLRKYQHIEVPTSYMVCDTNYDFFGGYDHKAQGGFIHYANRHIAPGKKQWTWGNASFGQAWDRELTEIGGPYFELMAGVYTDNQPDFSYLHPFETKTFSQYWWGYKKLGPVQNANKELAIRLEIEQGNYLDLGIASSAVFTGLRVVLKIGNRVQEFSGITVSPESPWQHKTLRIVSGEENTIQCTIYDSKGHEKLSFKRVEIPTIRHRTEAQEPDYPKNIKSNYELELVAEHLEQYRHPTRSPEPYLDEAIARDNNNYRALTSKGRMLLQQGQIDKAIEILKTAKRIATSYHPNPISGEVFYYLGLAYKYTNDLETSYAHFYKATWNYEWKSQSFYHLACIDMEKGALDQALEHIESALDTNRINNKARVLQALIFLKKDDEKTARNILENLLKTDPLDPWGRYVYSKLNGDLKGMIQYTRNDAQTIIDIAFEFLDCGLYEEIIELIVFHESNLITEAAVPNPLRKSVMTTLIKAKVFEKLGNQDDSQAALEKFQKASPDYCFPSRIHEQLLLEWALENCKDKTVASFGLGNLYFDKKRHKDAISAWEKGRGSNYATIYRNLEIAYWNHTKDMAQAKANFEQALSLNPEDMKVQFEYDQLLKIANEDIDIRFERVLEIEEKLKERDNFSVEFATLLNLKKEHTKAKELLEGRKFHAWEGGEGKVLQQYSLACLMMGHQAFEKGEYEQAISLYKSAINTPDDLGEKYHPLQAKAHIHYFLGKAQSAKGTQKEAEAFFTLSANEQGDFIEMAVSDFSEMTYYKALSMRALGDLEAANLLLHKLLDFGKEMMETEAKIDYFATSLPNLLVFEVDIQLQQQAEGSFLIGLAHKGLQNTHKAQEAFRKTLKINAAHLGANMHLAQENA